MSAHEPASTSYRHDGTVGKNICERRDVKLEARAAPFTPILGDRGVLRVKEPRMVDHAEPARVPGSNYDTLPCTMSSARDRDRISYSLCLRDKMTNMQYASLTIVLTHIESLLASTQKVRTLPGL